ncbi:MAG: response regulator transcription factor [Bacteroidota bacterium]|nr:MAG: response regulator transcription factor [Bacteroidota bacterium]
MITTLIIEDEQPAALRLEKLLKEISTDIEIVDRLDSVKASVSWLKTHTHPDLVMLDIQLADGISFDIFKQIQLDSFVIFTTAYDEFAIKAFELNSIDYLLKPIDKSKLEASLKKFERMRLVSPVISMDALINTLSSRITQFKKRFAVSVANKIKSIETAEISFFQSSEKSTFLNTREGRSFAIDYSLEKLEELLNPEEFFRINRQTMVAFRAIEKMNILSKSRIQLYLEGSKEEFLVSTAKSHTFRLWLDK